MKDNDNKEENNQYIKILTYLVTISILVIFRYAIYDVLNTLLVKPIFSRVTSDLFTSFCIVIVLILITIHFWKNKDHRGIIKYALCFLIIYSIIRFDDYWSFTSTTYPTLKYIELFAFTSLIQLIRHSYLKSIEKLRSNNNTTDGFIEDNVIIDAAGDSYERNQVAEQIAKQIMLTANTKAFAVGITGCYGSGKSSFVNLICNSLKKNKVEDHIGPSTSINKNNDEFKPLIVFFNPWDANTAVDIHKYFFDELSINLAKENKTLSSSLYNYYRRLNNKDTMFGNLLNNLRDATLFFERDLNDEKKRINEMMVSFPRKIIVVIDDLDRLHNEEVLEVLRLIRNTANFGNVTYIVAYDRQYVESAIQTINLNTSVNYLDKIFQLEIALPKTENHLVTDALVENLKSIIKEDDLKYLKDNFIPLNFESGYEESISPLFNTHRDIIRFVNSFKLTYSLISNEVDFAQLLYSQLLKFKFPIAYDLLYEKRSEILLSSNDTFSYKRDYELVKSEKSDNKAYLLIDILDNKYNIADKKLIKSLLHYLFDLNLTVDSKDKIKSIKNPAMFDLFFTNRISSIAISEHAFREHMLINTKNAEAYVIDQINRGLCKPLCSRILKMEIIDFKSKEIYETITNLLFRFIAPELIKKDGLNAFNFKKYTWTHFNKNQQIVANVYEDNYEDHTKHLKHLFTQHISSYIFLAELARNILLEFENCIFIKESVLYEVQFDCLVEGLQRSPKIIPPEVVWMFWGIRSYNVKINEKAEELNDDQSWQIHQEAIKIFKHNTNEKDLRHFLRSLIIRNMHSDDEYGLSEKLIYDVFGDKDLFTFHVANSITDDEIKNEFLHFVKKYINNGKPYVKYSFKYFNLS
ncbi:P-loop NTPase fold protein [Sphingobacterium sp. UDSM-2020]|uniref:KAP family P-loop NTPase fold protein n=1 Tax=Sphingobacterium sp. UDSM-2020 TaxID=2795738 RepID=UPI001937D445|nr:P-loop NTPase fold protein [Sphingobacterium sp. UDSM-2020]QQD13148.1 hypothetical protein JAZ75_21540 [Sphingobacterium sp. UDSM-2020]